MIHLVLLVWTHLGLAQEVHNESSQYPEAIPAYQWDFLSPGSFPSSPAPEDEVQELFEIAGRQPNVTNSVSFLLGTDNDTTSDANATWTWRVNITGFMLPESISPDGLSVVNEQWDLQWPGGGSFGSFLVRSGMDESGLDTAALSFAAAAATLPSNATSHYTGDCTSVFGSQCVQRLLQYGFNSTGNPATHEDCMDTLGAGSRFSSSGRSCMSFESAASI